MNPLTSIPPKIRSALYWIGYLLTTVTDITTAAWVAVAAASPDVTQPVWLIVGTLVLHLIANHLNVLAGANTPSYADVVQGEVEPPIVPAAGEHRRDDRGASDLVTILVALAILIAVIVLFVLAGGNVDVSAMDSGWGCGGAC